MPKSILIVAAERDLGLGLAGQFFQRGWRVTGTARTGVDTGDVEAAGAGDSSRLSIANIDVTDAGQIEPFLAELGESRFDVIYFNAGIYGPLHQSVMEARDAEFAEIMLTNTFGPIRLAHRLLDHLAPQGTSCFMSSHRGSTAINLEGGLELCRASKVALNMLAWSLGDQPRAESHGAVDPPGLGEHRDGNARRHRRDRDRAGGERAWRRRRCRTAHGFRIAADQPLSDAEAAIRAADAQVALSLQIDLSGASGVDTLFEKVQALGRPVDILCANAGHGLGEAFFDEKLDERPWPYSRPTFSGTLICRLAANASYAGGEYADDLAETAVAGLG